MDGLSLEHIRRLVRMGFTEEQAKKIAAGEEIEALTEKELLQFAHAWENDKVDQMKPLVEKYGWKELFKRLRKSVEQHGE